MFCDQVLLNNIEIKLTLDNYIFYNNHSKSPLKHLLSNYSR